MDIDRSLYACPDDMRSGVTEVKQEPGNEEGVKVEVPGNEEQPTVEELTPSTEETSSLSMSMVILIDC